MDATTFFLTYAQSDFTNEYLLQHLQSIKPVVWARVARERHADGSPHSHAIVRFGARVKTRSNMGLFDLDGRHPNIQVPRGIKTVLEYCAKGGDYLDHGALPAEPGAVYDLLADHARRCDRDTFDKCALAARISFQWASHIWARFTADTDILEAGEGIECLQLQSLQVSDRATIVVGPSGCGKTSWAKRVSNKPALWCTHLDDLKKLRPDHKCIIFDDMEFSHLPRSTQIFLVDNEKRSIHCRHCTAHIPAGIQKIFTCNSRCFIHDEAIDRRVRVFNIVSFTV